MLDDLCVLQTFLQILLWTSDGIVAVHFDDQLMDSSMYPHYSNKPLDPISEEIQVLEFLLVRLCRKSLH